MKKYSYEIAAGAIAAVLILALALRSRSALFGGLFGVVQSAANVALFFALIWCGDLFAKRYGRGVPFAGLCAVVLFLLTAIIRI